MDLSHVADDDYFSNNTVATRAFSYAEIVLPPKPINHDSYTPSTTSTFANDDDTKGAISEITTTAKTDSIHAQQQQELENAKLIIEKQRLEIQKLKDDQEKADEKYTNILSSMSDRLQEQDSEAATMKQEIANMIIQQQNKHSAEMQELYDRMMRQMADMLNSPQQQFAYQNPEPQTQESMNDNHDINNNPPPEHQDSNRQDTRC